MRMVFSDNQRLKRNKQVNCEHKGRIYQFYIKEGAKYCYTCNKKIKNYRDKASFDKKREEVS